jgi:hypothetical protein
MKRLFTFLFIGAMILLQTSLVFSQSNNTESLTITTYYPAPHGVYRQLRSSMMVVGSPGAPGDFPTFPGGFRLKPVTGPPPANTQPKGTIYFDEVENVLKYYNGTGGWQPVGGGSSPGDFLVGGAHTVADCRAISGNEESLPGLTAKICRVSGSACPSSWNQYLNWKTAVSKGCSASDPGYPTCPSWCSCVGGCCHGPIYGSGYSCVTGSSAWGNAPTPSCQFTIILPGPCTTQSATCYATFSEIGCI